MIAKKGRRKQATRRHDGAEQESTAKRDPYGQQNANWIGDRRLARATAAESVAVVARGVLIAFRRATLRLESLVLKPYDSVRKGCRPE